MDYGLKRAEAYKNLGFEEEYRDVIMSVLASIVLEQPIREEDKQFLAAYLKIKEDIPKEDILVIETDNIIIEEEI